MRALQKHDVRTRGVSVAAAAAALVLLGALTSAQTGAPAAGTAPYSEQEVTFSNGAVTLAGTLTVPKAGGPFPAVVLLTGSGAQNRNEELFGFKPFEVLADHLARQGVVVLRYDDRGVGGSTGSVSDSTTEDFAGDALAAVRLVADRPDVRPSNVGLLGHSEGAIAAAIAAARSKQVSFIVMLAGSVVRGDEILRTQAVDIARAGGADQASLDRIAAEHKKLTEALASNASDDEVTAAIRALARAQIGALPEAQRAMIGDPDAFVDRQMKAQLAAMRSRWFRFFVSYDPASALSAVRVPVLAIFGERDLQVTPAANRPPLESALGRAGNQNITVKIFPEANHLFLAAKTGHPSEYATLEKRFVAGFLDEISAWIKGQTGGKPAIR